MRPEQMWRGLVDRLSRDVFALASSLSDISGLGHETCPLKPHSFPLNRVKSLTDNGKLTLISIRETGLESTSPRNSFQLGTSTEMSFFTYPVARGDLNYQYSHATSTSSQQALLIVCVTSKRQRIQIFF